MTDQLPPPTREEAFAAAARLVALWNLRQRQSVDFAPVRTDTAPKVESGDECDSAELHDTL